MRKPALINPWMNEEELQSWIREATNQKDYQKRLVIWLTATGHFHAHQIAHMLGVSKQAVWLWIMQYNKQGPEGLRRQGRGGRRWSFLTSDEENHLLTSIVEESVKGKITGAKQLLAKIQQLTGKTVSLAYVYKLLKRNNWRKLTPRPRHIKADVVKQEDFKKNFPPFWKT